jgi:HAD superfamily hydrolase (TIGR01509 family)
MNFKGAIFDLDGTLVDSMWVWDKIDRDFLTKRGIETPPDYKEAITAMGFRQTAVYTIERFGLIETPEALEREWNEMAIGEYTRNVGLKLGAMEYLERLREKNVRLAIATNSPDELVTPVLASNKVRNFFDAVCTANDVKRGKEFPDIFLHAARELGTPPEECIVFEDILPAVKSAKIAGMRAYAVYDDSSKECWEELKEAADGFLLDFRDAPLPG